MKKAKDILQTLAQDIIERKKLPKELANWSNLKYDSMDVIEAMIRYGKQFDPLRDEDNRYIDINGNIPVDGDIIEFVKTKKRMTVLSMEEQGLFPPSMLSEEFEIITEK